MGFLNKLLKKNQDLDKPSNTFSSKSSDENASDLSNAKISEEQEVITPKMQAYMKQFSADDTPGWDAIYASLEKLYPDTIERHYATLIPYMLGGGDPLDGFSVFDNPSQTFHRHIISFGMSELYYHPSSADGDFSKWGFEFTMRVLPFKEDADAENPDGSPAKNEPHWAMNLMQNLGRYVFESRKWFEAYHFIPTNSPIRLNADTRLVGVLFVPDPQLSGIDTPNGHLDFLQMVALTQKELDWLWANPSRGEELADRIRKDNPLLITDLYRDKEYV